MVGATAGAADLSVLEQNYVDQQYGLFLHYNMGTYTDEEWAHSGAAVNTFDPTGSINAATAQWAATALAAGMKYGVLTTKHHDGFALWDTNQSTYDIASTSGYNDPSTVQTITSILCSPTSMPFAYRRIGCRIILLVLGQIQRHRYNAILL